MVLFVCLPGVDCFCQPATLRALHERARRDKAGYFFPHDEFYDDGLREAIKFVCETRAAGSDDRSRNTRRSRVTIFPSSAALI